MRDTLRQRHLGVQFIMDRSGNIVPGYGPSAHILPGTGAGAGLNNRNTVGMEIIARNNADVNEKQVEAAKRFVRERYPNTPILGHGIVNPGHKEADEGKKVTDAINAERASRGNNVHREAPLRTGHERFAFRRHPRTVSELRQRLGRGD